MGVNFFFLKICGFLIPEIKNACVLVFRGRFFPLYFFNTPAHYLYNMWLYFFFFLIFFLATISRDFQLNFVSLPPQSLAYFNCSFVISISLAKTSFGWC